MKILTILCLVLLLAACAGSPSKLERIEANEAAISALQNAPAPVADTSCPSSCNAMVNEKVDRAFERSQYK